jgi:hypothetical protein
MELPLCLSSPQINARFSAIVSKQRLASETFLAMSHDNSSVVTQLHYYGNVFVKILVQNLALWIGPKELGLLSGSI